MNRITHTTVRALTMLSIVCVGATPSGNYETAGNYDTAGDYDLDWHTIDGGGEMFSTGGDYELGSTIGQPDARTEPMTGGDYSLVGGFWVIPSAPAPPCHAIAWRSVRYHVGPVSADLPIVLDAAATGIQVVSETRRDGIQQIEVDFDSDVSGTYTPGVVAEDLTHGGTIPATGESLIHNGTTLVIEFAGGLPVQTCYRIDLAPNIPDLTGDTDCMVRGLEGDTNGDNWTDLIDMAQIKSENGSPVAGADVRLDVNLDGNIDLIDMALVKSRNGGSATCP